MIATVVFNILLLTCAAFGIVSSVFVIIGLRKVSTYLAHEILLLKHAFASKIEGQTVINTTDNKKCILATLGGLGLLCQS